MHALTGFFYAGRLIVEEAALIQESARVHEERQDPIAAESGPTPESIARARAAQQFDRIAFTRSTGVQLTNDGDMRLRRVLAYSSARTS